MKPTGLIFIPTLVGMPGFSPAETARLERESPGFNWTEAATEDEFLAKLPEATAVLCWRFTEDWQRRATKMRFLATPAAGRDNVKFTPAPELEVSFSSFHGRLMAETVIGMMLAFSRGIKEAIEREDEVWPRAEMASSMRHLRRGHAVILGFGSIGKWIGKLLKPFGVRLTGVNRANTDRPDYFDAADAVVALDRLDAVIPSADHLIVVLPKSGETDNIIDARRLGLLSPHAYVYNFGRGNAVDLDALTRALKAGALAGAGLDVFPTEPLPADSPVIGCPGLIRLPHVSAFGPLYMDCFVDEVLPKLERYAGK